MKQLLTKFLKAKTYRIMFLFFKIYFILLLISFYSTKTNMFFVLVFFKLGRPGCWIRPPSLRPSLSGFLQPPPPPASLRTSFVNDP